MTLERLPGTFAASAPGSHFAAPAHVTLPDGFTVELAAGTHRSRDGRLHGRRFTTAAGQSDRRGRPPAR